MPPWSSGSDRINCGRAAVRLPQRIARRRQFDRDDRIDRVLRPQYAVLWAAFFNFVAFAVFGLSVAQTIASGSSSRASSMRR